MRGWLSIWFGVGAIFSAVPASAGSDATQKSEQAAPSNVPEQFQLAQKVHDIGWRLATGNAAFCEGAIPAVGLQLHDMASYSDPDAVREIMGLTGDFAVFSSAKGSPAADAHLAFGREVAALNGVDPAAWPAEPRRDWKRTKRAHDWIDEQLIATGELEVTFANGRSVTLRPTPSCPSRFEIGGAGKRALAEGSRVILERDFPGFAYRQDELAAAIAHELAHNLLGHREWLDREGRKRRNVRLTEREADRLMPWLLANAGYDPAAAVRFMKKWGPSHGGGLFRKRTHDGWDERVEFIAAELPMIKAAQDNDGSADWSVRFSREIKPED